MNRLASLVAVLVVCGAGLAGPDRAEAATSGYFVKTYEVQVEYWFFDTDYYYWSTVYSTGNLDDAEFVYNLLLLAKDDGKLNQAAPNDYWRYIAVDVRLVTKWKYVGGTYLTAPTYNFSTR